MMREVETGGRIAGWKIVPAPIDTRRRVLAGDAERLVPCGTCLDPRMPDHETAEDHEQCARGCEPHRVRSAGQCPDEKRNRQQEGGEPAARDEGGPPQLDVPAHHMLGRPCFVRRNHDRRFRAEMLRRQ